MKKAILILFLMQIFTITSFAGDTDTALMADDNAKLFTATIEAVTNEKVELKIIRKIKGEISENEKLNMPYFEYNARKENIPHVNDSCFIVIDDGKISYSIRTTSTDPKTLKFINHVTNASMNMEGQSIYERIEKLINDGSYEEAEKKRISKKAKIGANFGTGVEKVESSKNEAVWIWGLASGLILIGGVFWVLKKRKNL